MTANILALIGVCIPIILSIFWAGWHLQALRSAVTELGSKVETLSETTERTNGYVHALEDTKVSKADCDRLRATILSSVKEKK